MELPDYLQGRASEIIEIESDGADKRRLWAVILGAKISKDGNQWCVLWGKDIMEGVVGFGETPSDAIYAFEKAMYTSIQETQK